MSSPTQRTLKLLRDQGMLCQVVEHWKPSFAHQVVDAAKGFLQGKPQSELSHAIGELERSGPGRRVDLFGFIDIVALSPEGIIGVQCTTTGDMARRRLKILTECCDEARSWLAAGGRIQVIRWKRYAKAVDRKFWRPTIVNVTADEVAIPARPF